MNIGKIVKSNGHTDYVCQVYGPGEVETSPSPEDYAFGSFVRMALEDTDGFLVGVIYDTVLLNPDFGNLGPRLSPVSDLAVFTPDYLAEKVTIVGITIVGHIMSDGVPAHGVPALAAQTDALVERMDHAAVRAFHQIPGGSVHVGYAPLLLSQGSPLAHHLLLSVADYLEELFEGQVAPLAVLRNELMWQATIGPLGGER